MFYIFSIAGKSSNFISFLGKLIEIAPLENAYAYKSADTNIYISGNTLKYMTNKAVEKTIEISLDNQGRMSYKGFATKNQYELICRTSLFDEIFGTFPNHYVALTDQVFKLPPEKQPWFFGIISDDEAEAKLMGISRLSILSILLSFQFLLIFLQVLQIVELF